MLKKFRLEDSKPIKTPMSTETKLTRNEEGESVDNTKYRGMIGTTAFRIRYPKIRIETIVYADSDHAEITWIARALVCLHVYRKVLRSKRLMKLQVEEFYVKALQVKYPIIDWEKFNRDDLVKLWDLVKEMFSTTKPTDDKEKELWVKLKRLFEPDSDDTLWKLQRERLFIVKRSSDVDVGKQAVSRTTFKDGK
ncbi:hypothetical protein Tco_1125046 [Tanacetum coccineum]|uniref:Uncharacterized protein n=1 Tax=Tanacetum coccineum TaxID=301880 RepID=A0ABQ5J907_9ASTR